MVRILLVMLMITLTTAPAFPETCGGSKQNAGTQAERGVKNILFGWTEIPQSIIAATADARNPIWGLAAGTFNGIGRAFPRTVSGIADVVTSPAANCDNRPVKPGELNNQIR